MAAAKGVGGRDSKPGHDEKWIVFNRLEEASK
jgi:hypothetical protein